MGEKISMMWNWLSPGLRHPLFLVIISSVIGSILIPSIISHSNREKLLQEARLKKAVDIVNNNTRTISQLNSLMTRLQMFHHDNIRLKPSPAELKLSKSKLIEDMNRNYLEFEKDGWWWYRDLNDEATILEIKPISGSTTLSEHINVYAANIRQTVDAISPYWHLCISADYDFEENGKTTQLEAETSKKLAALFEARKLSVGDMVKDFGALQPH